MGRYKVRLPFDLSDSKNYNASKYVRLAQPYSGSNYGIHFPSHDGAEMIVACVDGNPNKVMGIGTIPNPDTMSPVVSKNSRQSIIRTAGGNEMCMDDLEKKQKIHITTPDQNIVTLDDGNDNISIETTDKNRVILDDKNK
jgi:type VI secretion system secreted protein VgrG